MTRLGDKKLLAALSAFGYPLLETEAQADPNALLAHMVQSSDTRVLEGFPVVLANALSREREKVDLTKVEKLLSTQRERELLRQLLLVSSHLFQMYDFNLNLKFNEPETGPKECYEQANLLNQRQPLQLGTRKLDPERMKNTFLNYAVHVKTEKTVEEKIKLKDDFRREYFLSLLLSPRQKDLLYKKMRAEPMTKTEREYFSRVVRKKLLALADPDLHRLAQKALQ